MLKIGCCVPPQHYTVKAKIDWLTATLKAYKKKKKPFDAFFLPQEWLGGHYLMELATKHKKPMKLHFNLDEVTGLFSDIAKKHKVALGVGACITASEIEGTATEDYLYFDRDGSYVDAHRKFGLPAYDDMRSDGAGRLMPEQDFFRRITPIKLPKVGLTIGTIFCWEVYTRLLPAFYGFQDVNLIVHPAKFAPRGWLLKTKPGQTFTQVAPDMQYDELHPDEIAIRGFSQDARSQDWIDRLYAIAHYETMCPIAISCNTWDIGPKFMALTGHVDPFTVPDEKMIVEVPAVVGTEGAVHPFDMNPLVYSEGVKNVFSAGAYKAAVGSLDGLNDMRKATMSVKMRRLEAHLIGGNVAFDLKRLIERTAAEGGPMWGRLKKTFKKSLARPTSSQDTEKPKVFFS